MTTRPQAKTPVIVTFYSLMGGVGGSTTVANCAGLLAAAGKRTLAVDWDLAAPRMHDYLRPFMTGAAAPEQGGLIALARQFGERQSGTGGSGSGAHPVVPQLDLTGHLVRLRTTDMGLPGQMDFLPPTSLDDLRHLSTVWRGWDERPREVNLAGFAAALRRSLLATDYDYVLVDVPYGASDAARAGTELLPDVLVVGFRLAADGIDRTADLVRRIHDGSRVLRVLPVLMRSDPTLQPRPEHELLRAQTEQRFRWLLAGRPDYWTRMQIPDNQRFEGGEKLAVFAETTTGDHGLTTAYRRLVSEITRNEVPITVPVSHLARAAYQREFSAQSVEARAASACVLSAPGDRVWADWVRSELVGTGVSVVPAPAPGDQVTARRLLIVGASRRDTEAGWTDVIVPPECEVIALRTSRYSNFADLPVTREIDLRWRDEMSARRALQELFGVSDKEPGGRDFQTVFTPRFPRRWVEVRYLPPANPTFVGRRHELDELRDRLLSAAAGSRPYVLYGAPGTGKSQIALEYAERFATDYDQVWWIPTQTKQDARATLTRVARHLLAEAAREGGQTPRDRPDDLGGDLVVTALDILADPERSPTWLLVYDNVDVLEDIEDLLPKQGRHGHVIVTARYRDRAERDAGSLATAAAAEVTREPGDVPAPGAQPGPFTREDSRALFRRIVPALRQDQAEELAELAEDLPLAVGLIAAWIATDNQRRQGGDISGLDIPGVGEALPPSPGVSRRELTAVEDAVTAFRDGFAERRRLGAGGPGGDALTATRTVLDMALETLRVGKHGRAIRLLVELAAFLSPNGISRRLLYSAEMLKALREADESFTETTVLDSLLVRISRFGLAVVDHAREGHVLMHWYVQQLIREGMPPSDMEQRREHVLRILAAYCPPDGEVDQEYHRETFVELQRHLRPSGALESKDDGVRRWLAVQVRFLRLADDEGSKWEARDIAAELSTRWAGQYAPDDPLSVRLQIDLAHLLRRDHPRDSLKMFTAALSHQRRNLGLHHPGTLMTARGLGAMLWQEGAFGEAYAEDLSTLGLMRRVFGDYHPLTALAAGNLVLSEMVNGRFQDALQREQILQDGLIRARGQQHLRVLASRIVVGVILRELGRYRESADVLEPTLMLLVERYPSNEGNRLRAQRELALTRLMGGDPDVAGARKLIEDVLPIYRRIYGDANDDTLACRLAEAIGAHAAGDDSTAALIAAGCEEQYRGKYRADHPFVFLAQSNRAGYTRADDPGRALELSGEALEGLRASLDGDHPYLLLAHVNHARILADVEPRDTRRLAEAAELLEYARAGYEAVLGPEHPYTSIADENLRDVRARAAGSAARATSRWIQWTAPLI